MPCRALAASALGEFLGAIAHPKRIQIVEALRAGEQDVEGLQQVLQVAHSNVSQHLAVLRAHQVVAERREGRRVFYRLRMPQMADWLVAGMDYLWTANQQSEELRSAISQAKTIWTDGHIGQQEESHD